MGCGSSQAAATVQVKPCNAPTTKPAQDQSRPQSSRSNRFSRSMQSLKARKESLAATESMSSMSDVGQRSGETSARTSARTIDSGLGEATRSAHGHQISEEASESNFHVEGDRNPGLYTRVARGFDPAHHVSHYHRRTSAFFQI